MPKIAVKFDITLEDDEVSAMADAIGCSDQQLAAQLPGYAATALREYAVSGISAYGTEMRV